MGKIKKRWGSRVKKKMTREDPLKQKQFLDLFSCFLLIQNRFGITEYVLICFRDLTQERILTLVLTFDLRPDSSLDFRVKTLVKTR